VGFGPLVAGVASAQGLQPLAQMGQAFRLQRRPQIPQDQIKLAVAVAHDRGIHLIGEGLAIP
jgi:hypothetical protein